MIRADDYNPERVILDDVIMTTPTVNTGDTLAGATVGVLDYNFGNFKLLITSVGTPTSGGIAREVTAAASRGQLAMATFNVENLDAAEGPDQVQRVGGDDREQPSLAGHPCARGDPGQQRPRERLDVDASLTLGKLRDAVVAAGGPTYSGA